MNFVKTAAAATAIVALSTASFAGGLADEIMEAPVVMEEEMMAPATGSISPTIIVVGVLAALLLAATLQEDDDEGGEDDDGDISIFEIDPDLNNR
jgi:hypothetical protein